MATPMMIITFVLILHQYGLADTKDLLGSPYFLINMKVDSYILPFLNFSSMMLSPYIDTDTVEAHYYGHHDAYRRKTNALLAEWRAEDPESDLAKESILYLLQNLEKVPQKYYPGVKNQVGGFVNHCFYWGVMSPNMEETLRLPTDYIKDDIDKNFGSFEQFKEQFAEQGVKLFGSGYVWLVRKSDGSLQITTTSNQDSPISTGDNPILILDVWEHAYYLQHKFKRANHIADWWYVIDWDKVTQLDQWWKSLDSKKKDEL